MRRNKCPDCEKEVSDYTLACPWCGRSVDTFEQGRLRSKTEDEIIIENTLPKDSKSDKIKYTIGLVVFVLAGFLAKEFYPSIPASIEKANKSLPKKISNEVELRSIELHEKTIEYNYQLTEINAKNRTKDEEIADALIFESMRNSYKQSACAQKDFVEYLKKGYTLKAILSDRDGVARSETVVSPGDCK